MEFLESLNEAQQRAVTAPLQPILVLAGPGTGKTRTLVARILYLIQHHTIPPHKILAVTFTNKAKEEMKHRLQEELGDAASDLTVGTFHRFCMNVLREHHEKLGLPKKFAIADEPTQLLTLARVSRIQDAKSVRTVLNAISGYRLNRENLNPGLQSVAEKWMEPYHRELRRNALIDFDQILIFARTLFRRYPLLMEEYQQTFRAILVDEFQDTDPIQYSIMKALAWKHRNIFVVADDDQSIFAWRGAHIENIDQYVQDFNCRRDVIVLEQNYRSVQGIIDVATQLINCGPRFREKQINAATSSQNIVEPRFLSFPDDEAEMEFIFETIVKFTQAEPVEENIERNISQNELNYSDIAILYPTHAIGEQLETKLLTAHIPCQLIKRQGIFDQNEVRKLLLLLKLLQNPDDDVTLEQLFQSELRNDVAFQQIQACKHRDHSFRRTLYRLLNQPTGIAGISHSALHRVISTTFGTISNMLSYLEHTPNIRLPEIVNMLCTLLVPDEHANIHGHVRHLRDPFDIQGIQEVTTQLLEAVDREEKVTVCSKDAAIGLLCQYLLEKTGISCQVLSGDQYPDEKPQNHVSLYLNETSAENESQDLQKAISPPSNQQHPASSIQHPASSIQHPASRVTHHALYTSSHVVRITSPFSTIVTIFKLVQAITSIRVPHAFRHYVAFDLETTSGDVRTTRIVEIGATKVRDGEIVGEFGRLVNPEQPITQGAYNVHHISDDDVRDQPTFAELLPEFLEFIGDNMLVAHNGLAFDFPIILRLYKEATGEMLPNRRFDTLPFARRLFPGQPASVDALMERFDIEEDGERHRALEDTVYLSKIFECLQNVEHSFNRRAEHEELLEVVALGNYIERLKNEEDLVVPAHLVAKGEHQGIAEYVPHDEELLLFQLGARKLLSRFSELPEQFKDLYAEYQFDLEIVFQDLFEPPEGDDEDEDRIELVFSGREIALSHLKDLAETFKDEPIQQAIQHFLDHAALYNSQDDIRDVNAVNLLTIHSAKGLEFPVVFVSGVEKGNLPSFYSVREQGELRQKKLDEQRRLFYVALTRAKQQLFVTYVDKRGEFDKKRSQFLVELGVEADEDEQEVEASNCS
jgi:DNA polymerase III epsilon subunit family exonuclease